MLNKILIVFTCFLSVFIFACFPVSAASLFDVTDAGSPFYPDSQGYESSASALPDYALSTDGSPLVNQSSSLDSMLGSVSSGDAQAQAYIDAQAIAAQAYEDAGNMVSEALAETRASNLSIADAYLSSAIVDVFSRVVDSCPFYYKYAAYRLNASDSNEGYMLIGADAKVDGSYLVFEPGSQLLHYYRVQRSNGYQTYYEYKYDQDMIYDTYRIPFDSGQLIYTNMVSGYPVLSGHTDNYIYSLVLPVLIIVVCFIIVLRRKN